VLDFTITILLEVRWNLSVAFPLGTGWLNIFLHIYWPFVLIDLRTPFNSFARLLIG
jgi:hypothetical protein